MYASLLPEAKPGSLIGDDTPTYSYLKDVPARIHSMLSEVKLLWILREPLARSISNYWHAVAVGKEGRSIENACRIGPYLYGIDIYTGPATWGRYRDTLHCFLVNNCIS